MGIGSTFLPVWRFVFYNMYDDSGNFHRFPAAFTQITYRSNEVTQIPKVAYSAANKQPQTLPDFFAENLYHIRIGTPRTLSSVEILQDNCWRTLCVSNWKETEARVICRQLGYSFLGASLSSVPSPPNQLDVVGGSAKCSGNEENLAFCIVSLANKRLCVQPTAVLCTGM